MEKIANDVCRASLGKYADMGFELYEDANRIVVLEYQGKPVTRFTQHATITEIQDACHRCLEERGLRWFWS